MYTDPRRPNPFDRLAGAPTQPPSLWKKIVAVVAAGGVFVLALMFSVVLFAVVLTVGLAVWGWFWWKTRDLRKQMREQRAQGGPRSPGARPGDVPPGVVVIEGEVIREVREEQDVRR